MLNVNKQSLLVAALLVVSGSRPFGHAIEQQRAKSILARASSNVTTLQPQFFPSLNSSRVRIPYGPYTVPPSGMDNGMKTFVGRNAAMPCSDCIITWMQAGLEYPNGSYANANTSLLLHHTFMVNTAQPDAVCGFSTSAERFFASGNERLIADISVNGTNQAGYYLGSQDNVVIVSELMNEISTPQDAVVTITYEYIPSPPSSFYRVKPVWLDIGGCDTADRAALPNTTFEYSSIPWTSNFTGEITRMFGHLHDGGTHLQVLRNNASICDSVAAYGQTPGYIDSGTGSMNMSMPGMSGSMDMNGTSTTMEHISSMSACTGGQMKVGDAWSVNAFYNTSEYKPMINTDGSLEPVMGISLFYVAVNQTGTDSTVTVDGNASSSTSSSPASASTTSGGAITALLVPGSMVFAAALMVAAVI